MSPTKKQAAALLLNRRRARNSLSAFANHIDIPGAPISDDPDEDRFNLVETSLAKHHVMICDTMQQLIEGTLEYEGEKVRGAMFLMPPGGAKSTYGTVVAPTWAIGKYPGYNIITTSYGTPLALKQSRKSRQIVRSKEYNHVFNTQLNPENRSVEDWSIDNGSTFRAAGILSGITGNRADGVVIDDPIKGRQDAESDTVRNTTKAAIDDDLMTRLKPNGWVVYILTRWHEDDPVGRLLPETWDGETGFFKCSDGEVYYVLSIEAECTGPNDILGREQGEYFWPEWFPLTHWRRFKSNARTWASLYQQRPSPDDGDYYKRHWFKRYHPNELPECLNYYGTSDFATTDDGGDFTEHTVWGLDSEDDSYVVENWFGQKDSLVWANSMLDLYERNKTLCWFPEAGGIWKAVKPFFKKRMQKRRLYPRFEPIPAIHNKIISSRSFQGRASEGKVYIPHGPDGDRMIEQLVKFPSGKYDDFCDTCSIWGRALDDTYKVSLPDKPNNGKVDRWDRAFDDNDGSDDWKTA